MGMTGFTLVEMAVVLVILGLMLGGLMVPLMAQMDQRNYNAVKSDLDQIGNALIGYALSHSATDGKPYLPCPDTDGNGTENRVGSACASVEGDLPWADLGMPRFDAWGRVYRYRVDADFSNSATGFTLTSNADIRVRAAAGGTILATVPAVMLSRGKGGAGAGADETENGNADDNFVSRIPSDDAANAFDDVVAWITSPILINQMVTAGRLP